MQPIERVWCCVKNDIAERPVLTMTELDKRLRANFSNLVTEKVLASTYRQTQKYEDDYLEWAAKQGPEHAAGAPTDPLGEEEDEAVDTEGEDSFDGPNA